MKKKKCRVCKKEFNQFSTTQIVCTYVCAYEYAKSETIKKNKKYDLDRKIDTKRRKEALKSKADWFREAQTAFNAYIRERDKYLPCISCQRHHSGQYHAGHYRTTKAMPELRFHEFNNNKQCAPCNNKLSGNIVEYRINLINKIGIKNVEWLEGPHELQRLTIDDAKEIRQYYKNMLKSIKN